MKTTAALFIAIFSTLVLQAQKAEVQPRPVFKKGYIRIGFTNLGTDLNTELSPLKNVQAGSFGAGRGFAFDVGHNFYFRKRNMGYKINYGLDWTILNLSYTKLDKWDAYAASAQAPDPYADGAKISVAVATKLGPVIAYNPADKLVIEGRFQVAYIARVNDLQYDDNYDEANYDKNCYFSFDNKAIKPGIAASFGFTVRYAVIGLSLDYITAKHSTTYEAKEAGKQAVTGEEKIKSKDLQLKLTFSF